jgi:protein phosphatase PTC1
MSADLVDTDAVQLLSDALDCMASRELLAEVLEGVETLLVYASNLRERPTETKFHVISAINVHFLARLGHLAGAQEAMAALGYRLDGAAYVLSPALAAAIAAPSPADSSVSAHATLAAQAQLLNARRSVLSSAFAALPRRLPLPAHSFTATKGVGCHHDRGQRHLMEDDELVIDSFEDDASALFLGVYDGHGGRETVDFVVRTLHDNLLRALETCRQSQARIQVGAPVVADAPALLRTAAAAAGSPAAAALAAGADAAAAALAASLTPIAATASASAAAAAGADGHAVELVDSAKPVAAAAAAGSAAVVANTAAVSSSPSSAGESAIASAVSAAAAALADTEAAAAALHRTAFAHAYLRTDAQLRRANVLHSGSTSVTCLIRTLPPPPGAAAGTLGARVVYTANAGDSRAVLLRGRHAVRLSFDHKASCPVEQKRVEDAGGVVLDSRVGGMLAVSRALGDHVIKGRGDVVLAAPHTAAARLRAEDRLLVLACDGVWDVLTDQQSCDLLARQLYTHLRAAAAGPAGQAAGAQPAPAETPADAATAAGSPYAAAAASDLLWWLGAGPWAAWVDALPKSIVNSALAESAKALIREALDRKSSDNLTAIVVLL